MTLLLIDHLLVREFLKDLYNGLKLLRTKNDLVII